MHHSIHFPSWLHVNGGAKWVRTASICRSHIVHVEHVRLAHWRAACQRRRRKNAKSVQRLGRRGMQIPSVHSLCTCLHTLFSHKERSRHDFSPSALRGSPPSTLLQLEVGDIRHLVLIDALGIPQRTYSYLGYSRLDVEPGWTISHINSPRPLAWHMSS